MNRRSRFARRARSYFDLRAKWSAKYRRVSIRRLVPGSQSQSIGPGHPAPRYPDGVALRGDLADVQVAVEVLLLQPPAPGKLVQT